MAISMPPPAATAFSLSPTSAQAVLERAVGNDLPPVPRARDQFSTRRTIEDEGAFATVARQAGFREASVVRFEDR